MHYKAPIVLTLLLAALPVSAAVFEVGNEYSLPEEEVLTNDLYVWGGSVVTAGAVEGDLVSGGGKILVRGSVSGDVVAGGGNIDVLGAVGDDVRTLGGQVVIGNDVAGDVIALGGQVHVLSGVTVGGDVVVVGGRVVVDGTVGGGVRVYGDEVHVDSVVGGDLVVFADNQFSLGDNARVGGNLSYRAPDELVLPDDVVEGEVNFELHAVRFDQSLLNAVLGAAFLLKVLMLLVAGLLAVVFFGQFSNDLGSYVVPHFGKSLLIGFVLLVVVPAFIFLLAMSVIGLIVGAVFALAYLLLLAVAKVYAGIVAGALLSRWIRKEVAVDWKWAFIGIVLLQLVGLIPAVGWALSLIVMLAALGAISHFAYQRFWVTR